MYMRQFHVSWKLMSSSCLFISNCVTITITFIMVDGFSQVSKIDFVCSSPAGGLLFVFALPSVRVLKRYHKYFCNSLLYFFQPMLCHSRSASVINFTNKYTSGTPSRAVEAYATQTIPNYNSYNTFSFVLELLELSWVPSASLTSCTGKDVSDGLF